MRAFCITCAQSDRRPKTEAHFRARGLDVTFFQGIHGKTWGLDTRLWAHRDPVKGLAETMRGCQEMLNVAEMADLPAQTVLDLTHKRIFPSGGSAVGYRIDAGHIGLCLTHWSLWQHIWLSGLEEALIMEDDVDLIDEFGYWFSVHRGELPADWQVWYAGTLDTSSYKSERISRHLCNNLNMRDGKGWPWGTHCYAVKRSALPILMEKCQEARLHIDQLIDEKALPHLKWYCSIPSLANQHSASGTWPHDVGG